MSRFIVYVRGGTIQGVISDCGGNEVMIVDYDDEESSGVRSRSFQRIESNPFEFDRTIRLAEV